jgi:hypothetical protein
LVITCACLYNLCIGFGDHFDMDKANDAHVEAGKEAQSTFGDMNSIDHLYMVEYAINKYKSSNVPLLTQKKWKS